MTKHRKPTRIVAAAVAAASLAAAGLSAAAASASVWDSEFLPIYKLTSAEKGRVCGTFSGTISYFDGYTVNCGSGNVFYSPPATS